jgi:hypothetical protein
MAAAIRALLDNAARSRRLGQGARRLAEERWSLDAAVLRLEKQLISALRARQPIGAVDAVSPSPTDGDVLSGVR